MKTKILIFTDAFSGGGAEEVMRRFSIELGKDFNVLHVSKWLGPKQIFLNDNMISLDKRSSKECMPMLYKIAKGFKPDFIFSSTGHNNMIVLMLKFFLRKKPKIIIRESSVASIMKNFSLKSKLIDFFLMKPLYKTADAIIAQSTDILNDLIKVYDLPEEKISIINNPITRDKLKDKNNLSSNEIKLLTIGRFSPEKGYDRLLQIVHKLPSNYTLKIMGDGALVGEIKDTAKKLKIEDRIDFLGFLLEEQKLQVMRESDVYVQTSYVEGFPNSLLQSVAIGLPVIAYDVPGGTREIVNDINGCLVPDDEQELMVQTIKKINSNSYDPQKMQIDTINRFGVSKIMTDLKQVFTDLDNEK
tara:strand:- start:242 stop:1315 length:1074 start_codon:yes stop_codon:yes gene_type:complete